MTWLLWLYPPRWRHRYGEELRSLVGAQRFSIAGTIDLIAGAIDAWLHPEMIAAAQTAPAAEGETMSISKMMHLRCAGYGPNVTRADEWKSAGVMLVSTLVLTAAWVALHVRMRDNAVVDSLGAMPFFAGLFLSMRYTYLKKRSAGAQAIFIGGAIALFTAFFSLVGWIAPKI